MQDHSNDIIEQLNSTNSATRCYGASCAGSCDDTSGAVAYELIKLLKGENEAVCTDISDVEKFTIARSMTSLASLLIKRRPESRELESQLTIASEQFSRFKSSNNEIIRGHAEAALDIIGTDRRTDS